MGGANPSDPCTAQAISQSAAISPSSRSGLLSPDSPVICLCPFSFPFFCNEEVLSWPPRSWCCPVVGAHWTRPLSAHPTCSGMWSGHATWSDVQASVPESFPSTGLGCFHEELLALVREEFCTLQQQVPDISAQPPILLPPSSPAGGLQSGYCNCIRCG